MFYREGIKANQTINPASRKILKCAQCFVGNHWMYRKKEYGTALVFKNRNSGEVIQLWNTVLACYMAA